MFKFLSVFLLLSQSILAQQKALSPLPTQLRFHTQELAITSENISREMYKSLDTKEIEADLVHGLYFKYGEYLYCHREPELTHHCFLYLRFNGLGELSSFRTDSDFGKGNVVDAIVTKPLEGIGSVTPTAEGFHLDVAGELAGFLYKKMKETYADYDERKNLVIENRQGKDMNCFMTYHKKKKTRKYKCRVSVIMNQDNRQIPDENSSNGKSLF